ncbi:Cyclic nucleotide-binding domain-containing protein [Sulfidibacter corallicola]|uniref:Cyclic nucleotide-binding domain-containing protein n=1 Tax=Sulfidibacter corallicola TaxID=2818388 RepID=A0A8A4TLC3_SULCO|nr:cyclic nucleotide-binding domain-containing protein [Sulfidibacter corallicola]
MNSTADRLDFLRDQVPLFASLSDRDLTALDAHFQPRFVPAGQKLLKQGEVGREVFVVWCGLFEVLREEQPGRSKRVGWSARGDLIGEGAVFTDRPRSADVIARRDSLVLAVGAEAFQASFALDWPRIRQIMGFILERAARREARPGPIVIAANCANHAGLQDLVYNALQHALFERAEGELLEISDFATAFDPEVLNRPLTDPVWRDVADWFENQQERLRYVWMLNDLEQEGWNKLVQRNADLVVMFNSPDRDPTPVAREDKIFTTRLRRPAELVLVNPHESLTSVDREAWSIPRNIGRVHILSAPHHIQAGRLIDQLVNNLVWPERLSEFSVFDGLQPEDRALIYEDIRWVNVDGGETLVEQGEPAGHVYLISTGRFQVTEVHQGETAETRFLGPGDSFGATDILSDGKYQGTVRALRDGSVARIRANRFLELAELLPSLTRNLARLVAGHGRQGPERRRYHVTNIALFPISRGVDVGPLAERLAMAARPFGPSKHLEAASIEGYLGAGMSAIGRGEAGDSNLLEYFHRLEANHTTIVYACDSNVTPWTLRCLRQADRLVLVASPEDDPAVGEKERRLLQDVQSNSHAPCHLALMHPAEALEGQNTAAWLDSRAYLAGYHHLRRGNQKDLAALARKLTNRAIGVAFSGAPSRVLSHLGVYRAMAELNMPIDVLAGSSSGTVAAAMLATGVTPGDALNSGLELNHSLPNTRSFQPHLLSLTSGDALANAYRRLFGDRRIEDQFRHCVFTAVDINRHRLVRLQTGPIWLLVRASCALPAVWPPVWLGDDLLVDGGSVTYLPLDEILEACAEGLAVASDPDSEFGLDREAFPDFSRYGHHVSGWRILAHHLNPFKRRQRYPMISDVLFHTLCFPGPQQQNRLRQLARDPAVYFLRPDLGRENLFQVSNETARSMEGKGHQAALQALGEAPRFWE